MSRSRVPRQPSMRQQLDALLDQNEFLFSEQIRSKLTRDSVQKVSDFLVPVPSICIEARIKPKMKKQYHDENRKPHKWGTYKLCYNLGSEIFRIFDINQIVRFINDNGYTVNLHKPIREDLHRYIYQEKIGLFQAFVNIKQKSKDYQQHLIQMQLKRHMDLFKEAIEAHKMMPKVKPICDFDHIIPSEVIYVNNTLMGGAEESAKYEQGGKMKVIMNTALYSIDEMEIYGESNLLSGYCGYPQCRINAELTNHANYKHPPAVRYQLGRTLKKKIQKTEHMRALLSKLKNRLLDGPQMDFTNRSIPDNDVPYVANGKGASGKKRTSNNNSLEMVHHHRKTSKRRRRISFIGPDDETNDINNIDCN